MRGTDMSLSGSVIHSTDLTDSLYSSGKHRLQIAEQSARALAAAGWLFPWLTCRNALILVFYKSGQAATKLVILMISTEYYRSFLQRAGHYLSVAGLV